MPETLHPCLANAIDFSCQAYGISVYEAWMSGRFDPAKDAANLAKHGLSPAFGDAIFEDANHIVLSTVRVEDGELRFKIVGMVGRKLFTGVFVWREELPRFISVRRSNANEERAYGDSG